MDKTMTGTAEKLAEHLYGHSREKAIEWAKEDKFDSCYRQAEDIIELLLADGWRQCAKGQRTSQFCGQAEAAYAKGAEDMRERSKKACDLAEDTGDDSGIERDVFIWNRATRYCMNKVAALPITPTNTEGEQDAA